MAALYTAEEIIDLTEARLAAGMMPEEVGEISCDTRTISEGEWFIALNGAEFDGHDFLGDAFAQGALGCIVNERPSYPIASTSFPLLAVSDTLEALVVLSRNWRRRLSPKVIVVLVNKSAEHCPTGAICYQSLRDRFRTEYYNLADDSTGVVLNTVLAMDDDTQLLIIELSPTNVSHMSACLRALQPQLLIVASEGFAHLRMSLPQFQFEDAVTDSFKALDAKKTKLIIASSDEDVVRASEAFSGEKFLFPQVVTSGVRADESAAAADDLSSNANEADLWAAKTSVDLI